MLLVLGFKLPWFLSLPNAMAPLFSQFHGTSLNPMVKAQNMCSDGPWYDHSRHWQQMPPWDQTKKLMASFQREPFVSSKAKNTFKRNIHHYRHLETHFKVTTDLAFFPDSPWKGNVLKRYLKPLNKLSVCSQDGLFSWLLFLPLMSFACPPAGMGKASTVVL